MALNAATVWECMQDATANMVNGGGFNATRDAVNGVDYSQQTTAQLALTDLANLASSTTLTSATGGFTHAMEGNIIHITSGTNFTAGWYEIVTWTDTNTVTIDRTANAALNASVGVGKVGGALSLNSTLDDTFFEQVIAGNTIWIKYSASSYSLGVAVSVALDGTAAAPITIEGYNTDRGDNPTGTNRPTINGAANTFTFDNYWIIKNLIFTGTATNVVSVDLGSNVKNCKSTNTGIATRYPFYTGDHTTLFLDCEGSSVNGYAIRLGGYSRIIGCYFHDSQYGIHIDTTGYSFILNCIIDTMVADGIYMGSNVQMAVCGNNIYNCAGIGIRASTANSSVFINNIIDTCGIGASWTTTQVSNIWDYNNFYNNTTDRTNVTAGNHDTAVDPGFTDAPNGDFSITGDI